MPAELLQILIDAADRNTVVSARGWGDHFSIRRTAWGSTLDNVWVDPIGNCLMLQPLQLLPTFRTSDTGTPRLRATDFNTSGGAFEEVVDSDVLATDYYLLSDGTLNASATTTTSYPENRGFYLSNYVFAGGADPFVFCEFTFGEYTLQIWSNGRTQLYEGGIPKGSGFVTPGPTDLSGRMLDIMVLPYKRRSILIWSPTGASGWVYTDTEKPAVKREDRHYDITAAGTAKVKFPSGAGRFQLTPIYFAESGSYTTEPVECAVAPTAEQSMTTRHDYDLPKDGTGGVASYLVKATVDETFSADGTDRAYRGRINLLGSRDFSPFSYSFGVEWPTVVTTTSREVLDITEDVKEFRLHVAEDPRQSTVTFTVRNAGTTKYSSLKRKTGRHCIIKIGTTELFWGVLDPPAFTEEVSDELSSYDFTAKSIFRWFELPNCPSMTPWDGLPHSDFVKHLVTLEDFDDSVLDWPATPGAALGAPLSPGVEGIWQPKDGDKKEDWLRKVQDLTGWILDDAPVGGVMKLRYVAKENLPTTPVATFYKASADDPDPDFTHWARSYKECPEEPEATEVWVIGCRKDTEQLMAAVYIDFAAEDATLAEGSRPSNWMGRVIPVKIEDPTVETMTDLEKLAYHIGREVTRPRIVAEIEGEYRLGLWRYSPVTVGGENWRILEMDIECQMETENCILRPTQYKLELMS